jgi:5-dehydro-2-deoxygluconokinase
VRYNPEGDKALNRRQVMRLKRLSDYLHSSGRLFMVELYVDAEPRQLERFHGQTEKYDLELRPGLMVRTLHELQDAGVEPDVWKVEALDRRDDCVDLVAAARRNGRDHVGCIILGGGREESKVRTWLATAASVPGFIGFAVGRTTFWDPLIDWRANRSSREEVVAEIGRRYLEWVNIFEKRKPSTYSVSTSHRPDSLSPENEARHL